MEKKRIQKIAELCVFIAIANLPFLTITQLIGAETLIDSFQHPDSYQYIKDNTQGLHGGYIVLEKPTDQQYTITKGDTILYYTTNDKLQQRTVTQILTQQGVTTYYTTAPNEASLDGPIYDTQIIGKIKGSIDDTIWNTLSLQIWDLSTDALNIMTLFPDQ
jgi:hypothetical protein